MEPPDENLKGRPKFQKEIPKGSSKRKFHWQAERLTKVTKEVWKASLERKFGNGSEDNRTERKTGK